MSLPLTVLTIGASVGVGAVSAPMLGSMLSKPITGDVVPTRITDLAGYLTVGGSARGLDSTGFEDPNSETSFDGFEDQTTQTSVGTVSTNTTSPTTKAPSGGALPPTGSAAKASNDQKRLLAVASFGGALVIAATTFFLIRRVTR